MSLFQKDKGPLAIVGWWGIYEVSQSKRALRLSWVAIPNSFDDPWFKRLSRHPTNRELNGAILLAYELMVKMASRMPVRGILANQDGPLSPLDMSDMTGYEAGLFSMSFEILLSDEIGRLIYADAKLIDEYRRTQGGGGSHSERKAPHSEHKASDSEHTPSTMPPTPSTLGVDSEQAASTDRQTDKRGRGKKHPVLFSSDFARAKKACEENAQKLRLRYNLDNWRSRDDHPRAYNEWKKLNKQIEILNDQIIDAVTT